MGGTINNKIMSKMKSLLAMTMASIIAAQSEFSDGGLNFSKQNTTDPEWKRKKCKSCYNFTMAYQECSKNPNNHACKLYCKRK